MHNILSHFRILHPHLLMTVAIFLLPIQFFSGILSVNVLLVINPNVGIQLIRRQ